MLSIKKLKMVNYITYENEVIDFDKAFRKSNVVLIYGKNYDDLAFASDNGSGKSIIYDAIMYTLFGRTTKNSNKDGLIGKFAPSMMTELELTDGKNIYEIERYRKDSKYGNDVIFRRNGKRKKLKSKQTDMTAYILSKLGLSYQRVVNTSIFSSNDDRSRFIYLGDKDRKSLLSQLKGFEIFNKCSEIAKENVIKITREITAINNELEKMLILISRMDTEIKEQKKQGVKFAKNKLERIAKITRENKRILAQIKLSEKELKEFEKKIKAQVSSLKEKIKPVDKKLNKLKLRSVELITNISKQKANEKFTTHSINLIESKMITINDNVEVGEICDKCGNLVSLKSIENLTRSLNVELKQRQEEQKIYANKIFSLQNKYDSVTKELSDLEKTEKTNRLTQEIINSRLHELEKKRSVTNTKGLMLREELEKNKKSLAEAKDSSNVYMERVKTVRKEIKHLNINVNELKAEIKTLQISLKYDIAWQDGYGKEAIQAFALKSTVNEYNRHMDYFSDILTDGIVDIKLLTEKTQGNQKVRNIFELDISDSNKVSLPFKEWSKGQKKRIEIISSFALMNLETNLISEVFLDELFDGIDTTGTIKIMNLLDAEAKMGKRFVVMSHSEHIKNMFHNRAVVRLKNGTSKFRLES